MIKRKVIAKQAGNLYGIGLGHRGRVDPGLESPSSPTLLLLPTKIVTSHQALG